MEIQNLLENKKEVKNILPLKDYVRNQFEVLMETLTRLHYQESYVLVGFALQIFEQNDKIKKN